MAEGGFVQKTIYTTKAFKRQFDRLSRADKKAALAVRQAEDIITSLSLRRGGDSLRHKQTRNGELRLGNCKKYDLGSGYRLITLNDNGRTVLAFLGSHDACHQWLEKQKNDSTTRKFSWEEFKITNWRGIDARNKSSIPFRDLERDSYEEHLLKKVDQKTLRSVFKGICRLP